MKPKKRRKRSIKFLLLTAVAILAVGAAYLLITNKSTKTESHSQEGINIKFIKQGSLTFLSAEEDKEISEIDIEIADNEQLRARGLMYRNSLPGNAGMLFIFDYEEIQGFWMKNTYIALDMLFVNSDNAIVTIHHNTTPLKEWNYASTEPALYVVEVNAGYCLTHNIKMGDKIEFKRD